MSDNLLEDILGWNVSCSKPRGADRTTLENALALIKEEVDELSKSIDLEDDVEIADACADIAWVVIGLMYQKFGYIKTMDVFEEVSWSNHTKLTSQDDNIEGEIESFKDMGVNVHHVESSDAVGCFQDDNNKVRKPSWFKAPNIKEVLRG